MELERWQTMMQNLGVSPQEATYQRLIRAYSETHRRYHTAQHINATLRHLDRVADQADDVLDIEIALWFHDAIYEPFSNTNELDSAVWASMFLSEAEVTQSRIDRVYNLIMATAHSAETVGNDPMLIVDIDLSILGAEPAVYDQFEKDVRYEYKRVPYFLYRQKRKEILASFLDRDRIYTHDTFYFDLEERARANLKAVINKL